MMSQRPEWFQLIASDILSFFFLLLRKKERVRKLHNSDSGLDVIRICSFDAHSKNKGESKDEGERGRMINYD